MNTNRYAEFTVNVTGSTSLQARVNIHSWDIPNGGYVIVTVRKPNGQTCLAGADSWLIYNNGTMPFNFLDAMPGPYKVTIYPSFNTWFSIAVEILPR
ncbi:hypothetical protein D3C73_1479070 [compost metagenome]